MAEPLYDLIPLRAALLFGVMSVWFVGWWLWGRRAGRD